MTTDDFENAAKGKVAAVLPEILDITLQEYKTYIEKPATEEKSLSYTKKQAGAKAGAGHLMLLMKLSALLKAAGASRETQENISEIMMIARQEYDSYTPDAEDGEDEQTIDE